MLENLYTTKMSASKKTLQNRFMKIRSKSGRLSKAMAMVTSFVIASAMICAAVGMAAIDNLEITNGRLIINGSTYGIDIVYAENRLATHTESYYVPLRYVFEALGYEVRFDVDKTKYQNHIDRYTFPAYDYTDVFELEDGTVLSYNTDEWKKQFVKNEVQKYIYGQTELMNAQTPIIEMIKGGKTEYCQLGSKRYSKGYAAAPILINETVYIPIRAVAYFLIPDDENPNSSILWDDSAHDIYFKGRLIWDEGANTLVINTDNVPDMAYADTIKKLYLNDSASIEQRIENRNYLVCMVNNLKKKNADSCVVINKENGKIAFISDFDADIGFKLHLDIDENNLFTLNESIGADENGLIMREVLKTKLNELHYVNIEEALQ